MTMNSALSIAASGMRAASTRFEVAASNIANSDSTETSPETGESVPYRPRTVRQTARPDGGVSAVVTAQTTAGDVDLGSEVVDALGARAAYRASLAVAIVADDMSKSLLDAFSPRFERRY
jgi:flagellar basal body rod protein FlgC